MTTPTITRVEVRGEGAPWQPSETTTFTQPRPEREIGEAISAVVERHDYALDLITVRQVRARMTEDTGERLTLDEFARLEGWEDELGQLRSE